MGRTGDRDAGGALGTSTRGGLEPDEASGRIVAAAGGGGSGRPAAAGAGFSVTGGGTRGGGAGRGAGGGASGGAARVGGGVTAGAAFGGGDGGARGDSGDAAFATSGGGAGFSGGPNRCPHPGQKRAPGAQSLLHWGHGLAALCDGGGWADGVAPPAGNRWPHFGQNFADAAQAWPHWGQADAAPGAGAASGAPHPRQNFAAGAFSAPHPAQAMSVQPPHWLWFMANGAQHILCYTVPPFLGAHRRGTPQLHCQLYGQLHGQGSAGWKFMLNLRQQTPPI